jgi:predicted lipoprotein with Yx(FWY)xxD motif
MTGTKLIRGGLALTACLFAAVLLAACGSSNDSSSTTAAAATTTPASSGGSGDTVSVADSGLGKILVDGNGMTIYAFGKDTSGDTSACTGDCASEWPPVMASSKPTAGNGVEASKLTTFKRDDGTTQVAYNGHPLYTFTADSAPGDTNGNGLDDFGGIWNAVTSAGDPVAGGSSSSSSDTSTTSSSGGYSY